MAYILKNPKFHVDMNKRKETQSNIEKYVENTLQKKIVSRCNK